MRTIDERRGTMSRHPINSAVRFLLELAALAAIGLWGWRLEIGWPRFVLAFALPVAAGLATLGWVMAGVILVRYVTSYDRLAWVLRKQISR